MKSKQIAVCKSNAKFLKYLFSAPTATSCVKAFRFKLRYSENLLAGHQDVPAKFNSVSNNSINQYNL